MAYSYKDYHRVSYWNYGTPSYDDISINYMLKLKDPHISNYAEGFVNVLNQRVYSLNRITIGQKEVNLQNRRSVTDDRSGIWFDGNRGYSNTLVPLAYYGPVVCDVYKPWSLNQLCTYIESDSWEQERIKQGRQWRKECKLDENVIHINVVETSNIDISASELYNTLKTYDNYQVEMSKLANISARTKCAVFKVNPSTFVMCVYKLKDYNQMYNFIAVAALEYLKEKEDTEWKNISKHFYESVYKQEDITDYFDTLASIIEKIEFNNRIEIERKENLQQLRSSIINIYENKLSRADEEIRNLENNLLSQYTQREEARRLLEAAKYTADAISIEKYYTDNRIKYFKIKDEYLYIDLYCPMTNYNARYVEKQINNPNSIINNKGLGDVFKAVFVDEDYELYTYTSMSISLTGKCLPSKTTDSPRMCERVLKHPHIYYYNCFGSYSQELMKTAANMDLETLLLTCISVASNLNFTDTTVINTFCQHLNNDKDISCIKDLNTGEWLTIEELQENLYLDEVAATLTTPTTVEDTEVELVDALAAEDPLDTTRDEVIEELQELQQEIETTFEDAVVTNEVLDLNF